MPSRLRSDHAPPINGGKHHTMPGLQDITNTPRASLAQRKRHSVSPQPQRRLSFATPKVVDSPEEHDDAPAAADDHVRAPEPRDSPPPPPSPEDTLSSGDPKTPSSPPPIVAEIATPYPPRTPHGKASVSSLTLRRRPFAVLGHCAAAVRDVVKAAFQNPRTLRDVGSVFAAAAACACASREAALWLRYGSWFVLLGILSSVGIGVGLQTGALVLFPHVARLARAVEGCGGSVDGVEYRGDSWRLSPLEFEDCGRPAAPSAAALLRATWACGACAGLGAALGEVVPFAVARACRGTGRDPLAALFGGGPAAELLSPLSPRAKRVVDGATKAARAARDFVDRKLDAHGFVAIFTLALIPNAVFDVVGLCCGARGVPLSVFLGATTAAKVIRTPVQGLLVALAATRVDDGFEDAGPTTSSRLVGLLACLWKLATLALCVAFVKSGLEQLAQHRARALRDA